MGSFYLWIIGAPVVVICVAALISSAARRRRDTLIETTGQRAIGRVLDVGCDSDGLGSSTYWVRVQYNCGGEPVTAKVVVSHRDQKQYQAGQRVGLTYAPSRPRVVRLDPPEWALR